MKQVPTETVRRQRGSVLLLAALWVGFAALAAAEERKKTAGELFLDSHRSPYQKQYFGETVTLSLKNADLVEVLRSFAELGGFNMVIQPGVSGRVTVELRNVPWDQALGQILKINNLGMELTGGKVRVAPATAGGRRAQPEPMLTVSLELQHADAAVVARALRRPAMGVPSPGGLIEAVAGSNKLRIRDTRPALRDFGRVLTEIDHPTAAGEDPASLARRCVEAWDRVVLGRTAARGS